MIYLIHAAVRSLDKTVLVDTGIGRKRIDKTDILALGRFYRAHSRIVRVVNVADLEGSALTIKTARSQRRKLSLMSKLRNGVRLVHELRQLRRTEELLNCAGHGAYIYKILRRGRLGIVLNLHTLADDSFKTRDTDAELILQKLSHASDAAVSEVIDIVALTYVVTQSRYIVNGCDYVVNKKMLYYK